MKEVKLTTPLPPEMYEELAMRKASELGFNCYSKSSLFPDYDILDGRKFFYKWRGKVLAITILKSNDE